MKKRLLICLLSWVMFACATATLPPSVDSYVAADFKAPAKSTTVLLLPVLAEYPEFVPGEGKIQAYIVKTLTEAGYKVVEFPRDKYNSYWRQVSSASGMSLDANDAQRIDVELREKIIADLQKIFLKDYPHALLLVPKLALRPADLKGSNAIWDSRKMVPHTKGSVGQTGEWSGKTRALSLELIALNAEAKREFRTYTGLLLPYETDVRKGEMLIRNDLYDRPDEYRKGINIALASLIAP